MKKILFNIIKLIVAIYILICSTLYLFQEKIIFHPTKLPPNYQFDFSQVFEEFKIKSKDGSLLSGVLFKCDSSKGLIFYLHGNSGSIADGKDIAAFYTSLHYDVCMYDYRSFGKSDGTIHNLQQLFDDNQTVYDSMRQQYSENKIILIGYSLGTGFAAKLATDNRPKYLILQAPYYSLKDIMIHRYKIIPTFLLKYNIATNSYIKHCSMPIIDFHGTADRTVYYGSSLKLKNEFLAKDTLITLPEQGHNGILENEIYRNTMSTLLTKNF